MQISRHHAHCAAPWPAACANACAVCASPAWSFVQQWPCRLLNAWERRIFSHFVIGKVKCGAISGFCNTRATKGWITPAATICGLWSEIQDFAGRKEQDQFPLRRLQAVGTVNQVAADVHAKVAADGAGGGTGQVGDVASFRWRWRGCWHCAQQRCQSHSRGSDKSFPGRNTATVPWPGPQSAPAAQFCPCVGWLRRNRFPFFATQGQPNHQFEQGRYASTPGLCEIWKPLASYVEEKALLWRPFSNDGELAPPLSPSLRVMKVERCGLHLLLLNRKGFTPKPCLA